MVKFREKREEYLNKLEGVSEKSGIFTSRKFQASSLKVRLFYRKALIE